MWDYKGKQESRFWGEDNTRAIIKRRLCSPPARLLRSFAFSTGDYVVDMKGNKPEAVELLSLDRTRDI